MSTLHCKTEGDVILCFGNHDYSKISIAFILARNAVLILRKISSPSLPSNLTINCAIWTVGWSTKYVLVFIM